MMLTPTDLSKILNVSSAHVTHIAKNFIKTEEDEMIRLGKRAYIQPEITKKILQSRGVSFQKKEIVAFCNNKGGVGKSSMAVNTALRLSAMGYKTLLIDADSQANATSFLTTGTDIVPTYNLVDVINGKASINDSIVNISETLHLVASSLKNSKMDIEITARAGSENPQKYFSNILKGLDYNYIIWDLSPTITTANNWMMLSCTKMIIVTELAAYSLDGVEMTWETIQNLQNVFAGFKPEAKVLVNKFDERNKILLGQINRLHNIVGEHNIFSQMIKSDSKVNQVQVTREQLPHNSQAFKDLTGFISEFCEISSMLKQ